MKSSSVALLSSVTSTVSAWTSRSRARIDSSRQRQQRRSVDWKLRAGPFFGPEEEFDCGEEEECEIDWDQMPGFADDDQDDSNTNNNVDDELDEDLQPLSDFRSKSTPSLEKGRVQLEMNWQMDECQTDQDSCSNFCPDCAGAGRVPCRFCRGTGLISLQSEFRPCIICAPQSVGYEECSSCKGTGKIAPWASTMENYMNLKDQLPRGKFI